MRKHQKVLACLALLGFASRMLIPAGYMPAALGDGGPIKLCHGGLNPALVQFLTHRGGSHEHDGGHLAHDDAGDGGHESGSPDDHDGWEHCPVGAVFSSAAFVPEIDLGIQMLGHVLAVGAPVPPAISLSDTPYRARAPPIS